MKPEHEKRLKALEKNLDDNPCFTPLRCDARWLIDRLREAEKMNDVGPASAIGKGMRITPPIVYVLVGWVPHEQNQMEIIGVFLSRAHAEFAMARTVPHDHGLESLEILEFTVNEIENGEQTPRKESQKGTHMIPLAQCKMCNGTGMIDACGDCDDCEGRGLIIVNLAKPSAEIVRLRAKVDELERELAQAHTGEDAITERSTK